MVIARPQAAFAIMDAENQFSLGRERRATPFQQGQLLIGGQILQDIQNQNQTGWRKFEMTYVRNAHVCVQCCRGPRERLRCDAHPNRNQPSAGCCLRKPQKREPCRSRSRDPLPSPIPGLRRQASRRFDPAAVSTGRTRGRPAHIGQTSRSQSECAPAIPDWRALYDEDGSQPQ